MFSRSEKTEETTEAIVETSGERSPMVLAALAGLLAIAGAFLLVWYLNNGGDDVAEGDSSEPAAEVDEETRAVFVVTRTIPRNTSARELIDAPTVYLSIQNVTERFVAPTAIASVAELEELQGLILSSDVLPGEQLLRGRFTDPGDFDSVEESFFESEAAIPPPAGHHAVVIELPSTRAMGGFIRPRDRVTVVATFRASPPDSQSFEISVVALNSIEVLAIQGSLEVAGQLSQDVNTFGTANRGSLIITVAVTPDELTDLTYAMEYGQITLATALAGLENEDGPRAVTTMAQMLGDDGAWLNELDDGNLVDLISLYPTGIAVEGRSIELELPTDDEQEEEDADTLTDTGADSDEDVEPQPGDS